LLRKTEICEVQESKFKKPLAATLSIHILGDVG